MKTLGIVNLVFLTCILTLLIFLSVYIPITKTGTKEKCKEDPTSMFLELKKESEKILVYGLTTIPSRIKTVHKTIDSILQGDPDVFIILSIPLQYSLRFKGVDVQKDVSSLSERYNGNTRVRIHRTKVDYGPGTKLVGAVESLRESVRFGAEKINLERTSIIIADDDIAYDSERLQRFHKAYKVIADQHAGACKTDKIDDMTTGEGFLGFAIPLSQVKNVKAMYTSIRDKPHILYHDDIWISWLVTHTSGHAVKALNCNDTAERHHLYNVEFHDGSVNRGPDALMTLQGEFRRDNKKAFAQLKEMEAEGLL